MKRKNTEKRRNDVEKNRDKKEWPNEKKPKIVFFLQTLYPRIVFFFSQRMHIVLLSRFATAFEGANIAVISFLEGASMVCMFSDHPSKTEKWRIVIHISFLNI